MLNGLPNQLSVADKGVDLAVQQEYLEYAENIAFDQYSQKDVLEKKSQYLLGPQALLADKKETRVILAHNGTVESYRVIEKYLKTAEPELRDWGILALEECRMFLKGSLVDGNVGMLMTGPGGKGNRLRYFFVIRAKKGVTFAEPEKIVVELSFRQTGERLNSIVEKIQFHRTYVTMLVLIPLDVTVAEFTEGGIQASNQVDDLLNPCYQAHKADLLPD